MVAFFVGVVRAPYKTIIGSRILSFVQSNFYSYELYKKIAGMLDEAYAEFAPYPVIVVELDEDPSIRLVGNFVTSSDGPINGIDQNVTLNRALWTLAEGMQRLKAA